MSTTEFEGIKALVTGGGSGIGHAVVSEIMSRGGSVAVLDLKPESAPDGSVKIQCDLGVEESVISGVAQAAERLGGIDVVVNNAGIGAQGDVAANSDEEWHRVLNVDVVSIARVTREALPFLRQSENAAVVNTSSIAATAGLPERVLYSAAKGAVYSMTLAMAADHVREGIRVNAVSPGTASTPWIRNLMAKADDPEAELAALNLRQPHGRLVEAGEVAQAICYLASPANGSTVGTVLPVDGGMQGLRLRPLA